MTTIAQDQHTFPNGKTVAGPFFEKWQALASATDANGHPVQQVLGMATEDEQAATVDGTAANVQHFEGGVLASVGGTPAIFVVYGSIHGLYEKLGGVGGVMGVPTSDELAGVRGGRVSRFTHGVIYWTANTGAHWVHGGILAKYQAKGEFTGILGYPTTDETRTPDGIGFFNHFESGSIYWTQTTGAQEVRGAIRDRWAALGWERGILGYPTTDDTVAPDGVGYYNHFQHGSIYWTPQTGAHEVSGPIRDKWAATGWERGPMGYPVAGETGNRDGRNAGRVTRFQKGHISWTNVTGANPHANGTTYEVRLSQFDAAWLRSAHRDSDYVTLGVAVDGIALGDGPTIVNMGDIATGPHTLDLAFQFTVDNPDSTVEVTFCIVNSGHQNQQELSDAIKGTMQKLQDAGAIPNSGMDPQQELGGDLTRVIGDGGAPQDTSFWEQTGLAIVTLGLGLILADCDGPVAARSHPASAALFTGATLNDMTANNPKITRFEHFTGSNSPGGCGGNSQYNVHWSITRLP